MSNLHEPKGSLHREAEIVREEYMAAVNHRLARRMSAIESFEVQKEIRGHLMASAAAHEEVGLDPLTAMREAVRKFGDPSQMATELALASQPPSPISPRLRALIAVVGSAEVCMLVMIVVDQLMVRLGFVGQSDPVLDALVGSAAGAVIGMVARFVRLSPWKFGLWMASGALVAYWWVLFRPTPFSAAMYPSILAIVFVAFASGLGARQIAIWERRVPSSRPGTPGRA